MLVFSTYGFLRHGQQVGWVRIRFRTHAESGTGASVPSGPPMSPTPLSIPPSSPSATTSCFCRGGWHPPFWRDAQCLPAVAGRRPPFCHAGLDPAGRGTRRVPFCHAGLDPASSGLRRSPTRIAPDAIRGLRNPTPYILFDPAGVQRPLVIPVKTEIRRSPRGTAGPDGVRPLVTPQRTIAPSFDSPVPD